jgi:NAD(P)-dependent dehydrogenase (short-subunit alcohol dehydrogenase family)
MMDLNGKRALVTGGSRGIGAAIAQALAECGADVAISYERSADRAQAVVDAIKAKGRRGLAIQADAGDPEADKRLVDVVAGELGGLDILVNNAGVFRPSAIAEATLDDINTLLNVNIRGVVLTTQAAIPYLGDGGRIITIGSNLGERVPLPGLTLYSLTKSAHLAFTRGLARELGAKNITVNLVQPGPVDTELNPADGTSADLNRSMTALGRYATPAELAAVVVFLASPAASYMTGSVMTADGGFNA